MVLVIVIISNFSDCRLAALQIAVVWRISPEHPWHTCSSPLAIIIPKLVLPWAARTKLSGCCPWPFILARFESMKSSISPIFAVGAALRAARNPISTKIYVWLRFRPARSAGPTIAGFQNKSPWDVVSPTYFHKWKWYNTRQSTRNRRQEP